MIAFDAIVLPFPVNMSDAVKMRIVAMIQTLNDLAIPGRLVSAMVTGR